MIMRKFFTLLAATMLFACGAWAANPTFGEAIADNAFPYTRYISGFSFNKKTQALTFTDNFQQGQSRVRDYYIVAAQRTVQYGFYYGGQWDKVQQKYVVNSFMYGDKTYAAFGSQAQMVQVGGVNTANAELTGGQFQVPAKYMRDLIAQCASKGYTKVRLFVRPVWRSGGEFSYYYAEDQESSIANKWYANFYDVEFSTISAVAQTPTVTVDYGNSLTLNGKVFGVGEMTYTWQKNSSLNGNDWLDVQYGTLTSAQAKAGTGLQYTMTFNKNSLRPCNYRLIARTPSSGDADTCVFVVNFRYPLTFPNGTTQYYKAGDEVIYGKGTVCTDYKFGARFAPQVDYSNNAYISFPMPPCPVTMTETTAKYLVQFLDNDGKELKYEWVDCGEDATPPTSVPEIAGMEFVGWSGDYTNVRKALKLKAIYSISGAALELTVKEHKTYMDAEWKFNSVSHDYFQGSNTRALSNDSVALSINIRSNSSAKAWICTGRLYTGSAEIQWNDGGYEKSVSANDAQQGKVLEWTLPVAHSTWSCANNGCPKSNEQWSIVQEAYRIKVTSGGNTVYSNPIVFDVYYALTIASEHELYVKNDEFWMVDKSGMIPVRAGEKVYIQDNEVTANCALTLSGTDQSITSSEQGTDEDGTWYIPNGQTDQMTVAPKTYNVIFKIINPSTHAVISNAQQAVACGTAAVEPEVPAVEGYAFMGWESDDAGAYADDAYQEVVSDNNGFPMQFNAKWQKVIPDYTVRWVNKDDGLIKEETVKEGESATPPEASAIPVVAGYTFIGWDADYSVISSDITIKALYSEDEKFWTITYKYRDAEMNEQTITTEVVKDGCDAVVNVEIPTLTGMTFTGWDADLTNIHSDIETFAQYEVTKFVITFVDWDGTVLKEYEELIDWDVVAPADPTREPTQDKQYKFKEWSPALAPATSDVTYTAVYTEEPREYSVRFVVGDDEWFAYGSVQYGQSAAWIIEGKEITAPDGYYFKEWDKDYTHIIADLVVNAVFEKGNSTSLEEVKEGAGTMQETDVRKVLLNGNLYILKGQKVYTILGAEVR